jgi:hypothetical protein
MLTVRIATDNTAGLEAPRPPEGDTYMNRWLGAEAPASQVQSFCAGFAPANFASHPVYPAAGSLLAPALVPGVPENPQ